MWGYPVPSTSQDEDRGGNGAANRLGSNRTPRSSHIQGVPFGSFHRLSRGEKGFPRQKNVAAYLLKFCKVSFNTGMRALDMATSLRTILNLGPLSGVRGRNL